jgi:hypothetical protein
MTSPAYAVEQRIAAILGVRSEAPVLALVFVIGLVILPGLLLGAATIASNALDRTHTPAGPKGPARLASSLRATVVRYAYALVPVGLGVWIAHYGFHLLTGIMTAGPVAQSAAIDAFGRAALGEPSWSWVGMQPGSVFPIQLGFVLLGAAGSVALVRSISRPGDASKPSLASAPWLVLVAILAATAVWILAQPMDMRAVTVLG